MKMFRSVVGRAGVTVGMLRPRANPAAVRLVAAAAGLALATAGATAQTWTRLTRSAPGAVNLMLLLSDGRVLAANNTGSSTIGSAWYLLTPDIHGSYLNGIWTSAASMHDTRLYYSSQVLKDGRVFVAGGEYGSGAARAEVYDPTTNLWTLAPIPTSVLNPGATSPVTNLAQGFLDSGSEILPDGSVMISPVCPAYRGQTVIYNPATNAWSNGATLFRGGYQDEASWVKLGDGTILTIDPFGTNSERYIPSLNAWLNDAVVPVVLYDSFGSELGASMLQPDGRAFYLGATGHTALYTPSGTSSAGAWAAGADIPSGQGTPDAPAAMLVTGNALCAVSPVPTSANHFPAPTRFYEYNVTTNTFTLVGAPGGTMDNRPTYQEAMLDLPDGSVLYSHFGTDLWVYRPAGAPLAAAKPVIQTITDNGDETYHVSGLRLNGLWEGAAYGDDLQMNSNYPLVRLSDPSGNVYYARTFNWSSTGVRTGNQVVTVEYRLPQGLPAAQFSLSVVANGIASDPVTTPVITSGPGSATGCIGMPAQFSISVSGVGPLAYQWRRGDTPLFDVGTITGSATPTLTIGSVGPADIGSDYNCVVTNVLGSTTSASASLSVCYANCDCSTAPPILNVNDFQCFLNKFAAGDPTANCDGSTSDPILNVNDFQCFLNLFAAGCP